MAAGEVEVGVVFVVVSVGGGGGHDDGGVGVEDDV